MAILSPCSTQMLEKLLEMICGKSQVEEEEEEEGPKEESNKIKGKVVLMKKNVLDFKDVGAALVDRIHEVFGKGISLQLVSVDHADPGTPSSPLLSTF